MKTTTRLVILMFLMTTGQIFSQDDEFNSTNLGSQWSWVRENKTNWFLSGMFLEIRTEYGALNGKLSENSSTNSVNNILLQPAPIGTFRFETRLSFSPDTSIENAGLIYYLDDDNYIRVSRGVYGNTNGAWMEWEIDGKTLLTFVDNLNVSSIYLRLSRTNNSIFSATYSVNGTSWNLIGTETILFSPSLPPPRIGLQAANGIGILVTNNSIPARFDYFHFLLTPVEDNLLSQPQKVQIQNVFPNPVSLTDKSSIQIKYDLPRTMHVNISIMDLLGREIASILSDTREGGTHQEYINVNQLPPGVYFIRLRTEKENVNQRFVILK